MPNHLFAFIGPGRVHCHGEPPLSLRVGDEIIPCPDPAADCCIFEPTWEEGTVDIACVNPEGEGEWIAVDVPEPSVVFGLIVCAVFVGILGLIWRRHG